MTFYEKTVAEDSQDKFKFKFKFKFQTFIDYKFTTMNTI